MGKIGDLFVRLGLKSDDYKKGMADAKKETTSFSQSLGKMKAGALAVWAAIGTAVVAVARDFVNNSNKIGDAWNQTMAGMKQSWNAFRTMLVNGDFKNFGERMKEAFQGGKAAAEAEDSIFEITNRINIARAKMQGTLNDLYFTMTDPAKEYKERIRAGKEYLRMQEELYNEEIALRERLKAAAINKWLAGSGTNRSASDVETFFSGYAGSADDAVAKMFPDLREWYEGQGDAANQPVVDAIIGLENAIQAHRDDNTRVIKQLQSLGAQVGKETIDLNELLWNFEQDTYEAVDALKDVEIKTPPIDTSSLDRAEQELKDFTNAWSEEQQKIAALNTMLSDSIVQATTAGMEAFTDMLFGLEGADASAILGALMQPFADTATQLGGMLLAQGIAVEAFKTSLASLQGVPAIAAGLSLIAIGAAMKSGIKALAKGGGGSGSTASYGGSSYGSTAAQNYESTLTVNVVGHISGSDIALSLDRTRKNQKR
jgi:hypothetical protein